MNADRYRIKKTNILKFCLDLMGINVYDQMRDLWSILNFFQYAIWKRRDPIINRIVNEYGQDPKNAESVLNKIDKGRANYHKFYTGTNWRSMENYDLCINTSKTGIQGAVMAIKACAEEKFGKAEQ